MFMKGWKYKKLLAALLAVSLLGGCTSSGQSNESESLTAQTRQSTEHTKTAETEVLSETAPDAGRQSAAECVGECHTAGDAV